MPDRVVFEIKNSSVFEELRIWKAYSDIVKKKKKKMYDISSIFVFVNFDSLSKFRFPNESFFSTSFVSSPSHTRNLDIQSINSLKFW